MEGTKWPHGGSDCNVTIREQPVATPEWQTRVTVEDDMKPRVHKGRLLLAGGTAAISAIVVPDRSTWMGSMVLFWLLCTGKHIIIIITRFDVRIT